MIDAIVDEYIGTSYAEKVKLLNQAKSVIKSVTIPRPDDMAEYAPFIEKYTRLYDLVSKEELKLDQGEIRDRVKAKLDEYAVSDNAADAIASKYEALIEQRKQELKNEAVQSNEQKVADFNASNQVYVDLENKRKELEQYSDIIVDACHLYGVTSSDVNISNESFTIEQLSSLYDQYIQYMKNAQNTGQALAFFKKKVPNIWLQGVALLAVLLLTFTSIFDFLAILCIGYVAYLQYKSGAKVSLYTLLLGLIYNVHPLDLGFKASIDEGVLVSEDISDDDERFVDILDAYEAELNELDTKIQEMSERRTLTMQELFSKTKDIQEKFTQAYDMYNAEKELTLKTVKDIVDSVKQDFEEQKSKFRYLGTEISKSAVFNTKFRLGLHDGVIEDVIDIGLKNIVIKPNRDEELFNKFLRVLLMNAMCNVKAGNLAVYVYDPNNMGQGVIDLYDKDYEDLFVIKSGGIDKVIEDLSAYAQRNLADLKSRNINEYNKQAEETGRVEKDYKLLLVLSQPKKVEENEALRNFMTYSANMGVLVWLVSTLSIPDTYIFKKPFEGIEHPYDIDLSDNGREWSRVFKEARKKNSPAALLWEDFIQILCPEDKMWTYCGDDFIDVDPGLENGDPDKSNGYTVGNKGDIHALAVGMTGAGKSVFLNSVIASMCQKYSPTDLQLWLIDYKCLEFGFYLPKPGQEYTFPHIRACLTTTDGDYAESVYAALSKECEDRSKLFSSVGEKNLGGYNRRMVREGTPEKRLPRIVFVNDEFQVIFEKAQGKILDSIQRSLTNVAKLGRALGIHLFFTSQSMVGTVKGDVLNQFSLRFGLKCAESTSLDILGTKKASDMKETAGFVIVKSSRDKSLDDQRKYKVPFLDDKKPDVLLAHMKKCWDKAVSSGIKMNELIEYDEKRTYSINDLAKYYDELESNPSVNLPESGLFILGHRMTYSTTNRAPENVILTKERGSNIFAVFADNNDLIDFYKASMLCIDRFKKKAKVFVNAQAKDLYYLCEVEKAMTGELEFFGTANAPVKDLVGMFEKMLEARQQAEGELEPSYFLLIGWDAAEGIGYDKDSELTSRLAILVKTAGEYDMHFIFICNAIAQMGKQVIAACAYGITGTCDESSSYAILDTKQGAQPSDMKNGFLYLKVGNNIPTRAKLWISPKERTVQEKTLKL